ncbi:hypothetical protein ElyMa_005006600, partial [Elysia marginata]
EIQVLFHRYHLYELDYNDYEMVATTGEETVLLDRRMYVEDYMDLLENTTLLTVRPIRLSSDPVRLKDFHRNQSLSYLSSHVNEVIFSHYSFKMVSIGMVIDKSDIDDDANGHSVAVKELRLPRGKVITDTYMGLENAVWEEIEFKFLSSGMRDLDPEKYEMVVTTGEETIILDKRALIEDFMELLQNATSVTVRPITTQT